MFRSNRVAEIGQHERGRGPSRLQNNTEPGEVNVGAKERACRKRLSTRGNLLTLITCSVIVYVLWIFSRDRRSKITFEVSKDAQGDCPMEGLSEIAKGLGCEVTRCISDGTNAQCECGKYTLNGREDCRRG